MPAMVALEEWVCDTCGNTLTEKEGILEWLEPEDGPHSFRIVHTRKKCLAQHQNRRDIHLGACLGPRGVGSLLAIVDPGRLLDPEGDYKKAAREIRSYADIFRRLQLPYYEEARLYFSQLLADEGYESYPNHEMARFSLELCKSIIARYEREK